MLRFLIMLTLIATLGCTEETPDPPGPPANLTVLNRLMANPIFDVVPADSTVDTTLTLPRADGNASHPITIVIERGTVQLSADASGLLTLTSLDLEGTDLTLDATALPPSGLNIQDLHGTLMNSPSGPIEWFGGGQEGHVDLQVDLDLEWSITLEEGMSLPLEPRTLSGWALHGRITVDASDNLVFTLEGSAAGPWSWGTVVELSEAAMNLRALEQSPAGS